MRASSKLNVLISAMLPWVAAIVPLAGSSTLRAETVVIDGVAAYVNEHAITVGDVMQAVEPVRRKLMAAHSGSELREKLEQAFKDTLQNLIERRLILDAFDAQKGSIPEWVVDQRVNEVLHDAFDDDRDALEKALGRDNMSMDSWRNGLREQLIIANMRRANVEQGVRVPASAVRDEYERNRDAYRTPAMVRLRLIVIEAKAAGATVDERRELARALRKRIVEGGESFAAVAQAHSEDSKAGEGGDWGWVDPAQTLRSELAAAVAGLEVGAVSDVIETGDAFYLVTVEERREAVVRPFEEVRAEIEDTLRRAESERAYRAWIERLGQDSFIKVLGVGPF